MRIVCTYRLGQVVEDQQRYSILSFFPFPFSQNYPKTRQNRGILEKVTHLIPDELYPREVKELWEDTSESTIIPSAELRGSSDSGSPKW